MKTFKEALMEQGYDQTPTPIMEKSFAMGYRIGQADMAKEALPEVTRLYDKEKMADIVLNEMEMSDIVRQLSDDDEEK
jgi:hypothetical protein